ncbi:hypothetical protein LTS18_010011, partial [Coniosporium uncinatum]
MAQKAPHKSRLDFTLFFGGLELKNANFPPQSSMSEFDKDLRHAVDSPSESSMPPSYDTATRSHPEHVGHDVHTDGEVVPNSSQPSEDTNGTAGLKRQYSKPNLRKSSSLRPKAALTPRQEYFGSRPGITVDTKMSRHNGYAPQQVWPPPKSTRGSLRPCKGVVSHTDNIRETAKGVGEQGRYFHETPERQLNELKLSTLHIAPPSLTPESVFDVPDIKTHKPKP